MKESRITKRLLIGGGKLRVRGIDHIQSLTTLPDLIQLVDERQFAIELKGPAWPPGPKP